MKVDHKERLTHPYNKIHLVRELICAVAVEQDNTDTNNIEYCLDTISRTVRIHDTSSCR